MIESRCFLRVPVGEPISDSPGEAVMVDMGLLGPGDEGETISSDMGYLLLFFGVDGGSCREMVENAETGAVVVGLGAESPDETRRCDVGGAGTTTGVAGRCTGSEAGAEVSGETVDEEGPCPSWA